MLGYHGLSLRSTIHRQSQIDGWQELGIAEGSGPAAHQCLTRDACVEDAQRVDQLAFEKVTPAPFPGQCRQRSHKIEIASYGAIGCLVPPDRE